MPKSPRFQPNPVRGNAARVLEVLAYPSVQLLDVTGPLQVFVCANDHVAQAGGTPPYVLRVVARDGQGVTTSAGLGIATSPFPRTGTPPDTLMVAGGPGVDAAAADTGALHHLAELECAPAPDGPALVAEIDKTNARIAELKGQLDVTSQKLGLTQDELARARGLAQSIKKRRTSEMDLPKACASTE